MSFAGERLLTGSIGAGFKRYAKEWKEVTMKMINAPYEEAKRQMVSLLPPWPLNED